MLQKFFSAYVGLVYATQTFAASQPPIYYQDRMALGRAAGYLALCPFIKPEPALFQTATSVRRADKLDLDDALYISEQRMVLAGSRDKTTGEICAAAIEDLGPNSTFGFFTHDDGRLPFPLVRLMSNGEGANPLLPEREAVRHTAGIFHYLLACPQLELTANYASYLKEHNLKFDDAWKGEWSNAFNTELMMVVRWQNADPERAQEPCTTGVRQYGPLGKAYPGFLRLKKQP